MFITAIIVVLGVGAFVSNMLSAKDRQVEMTPELWERLNPGMPYPLDK